jgi:hypothetical protein
MRITAFTRSGIRYAALISDYIHDVDKNIKRSINEIDEFVIVTPQLLKNKFYLKKSDIFWNDIYRAWYRIEKLQCKSQIPQWRVIFKFGEEIIPDLQVFRLRADSTKLFCLLPQNALTRPEGWLIDLFGHLSIWHQILNGDGVLHAAGVIRNGRAVLFLGRSGAGKTTIAGLSSARGYDVIHDDRILVRTSHDKIFLTTNRSFSKPMVPLEALVFIHQSSSDQLLRLSSATTALKLFENLPDINSVLLSSEPFVRTYFTLCSSLARTVPGYDLHFRKSSDFWDLIERKIGD